MSAKKKPSARKGKPRERERSKRKARQTPRKVRQTPRKAKRTPRKARQTPRKAEQTPRKAKQTPRKTKPPLRKTKQPLREPKPRLRSDEQPALPLDADEIAKRGSALMQVSAFNKALALFDEALSLDPSHLYALYGAAYSLSALEDTDTVEARVDRILELAERLIARTPEDTLWPYLHAHMFPRATLRFAHDVRARWWMKRSTSESDLRRALAEVDLGLRLRAPTESEQVLLGLWDTKVHVLLALGMSEEAFSIVHRFPSFASMKDVSATDAYRAWEQTELARAPSLDDSGAEAVMRLRDAIARHGHPTYAALVFSEPLDPIEIAMAERKLGVALPPSYVAFVTRYGCFKLVWDAPSETDPSAIAKAFPTYRGCRQLLPPAEIASETLSIREAWAKVDDPQTAGMLGDSLLFQENFYRDNFFTFRASSAKDRGGEMTVHAFFHDDLYEWRVRTVSFDEHLREWAEAVRKER